MIFLDTHIVAWLYEDLLSKIPARLKTALEQEEIYISPMVEFELDLLHEIGRLVPKGSEIIRNLEAYLELKVSRVDFYRVVEAAQALDWTRDPFDRLIVANAKIFQAPLITKDKNIRKYYPLALWD